MKTSIPFALAAQTLGCSNYQKEQKIIRIRSDRSRKGKAFLAWVFLVAYGLCGSVHAFTILAGSDYFRTIGGEFDFNAMNIPGIGVVDLDPFSVTGGPPVGPGNTDTIITRLEDATIPDDPISLDTVPVRLSEPVLLQSAEPVKIGVQNFNVRLTLTPLPQQNGAFDIQFEFGEPDHPSGGVFDSTPIPVDLEVSFTPTSGGPSVPIPPQPVALELSLPDDDSFHFWATEPEPGGVIVTGAPGDLSANRHIPLNGRFDFFPDLTEQFPWRIFVSSADRTVGRSFFDLQSASGVPDEGPGIIIGALLLMGICIGSQLWRRRFISTSA
jgi:hypothetical protein